MTTADPEEVVRVLAQLREEHPDAKLSDLCDLIDWQSLRQSGESYLDYQTRVYGPLEPR